MSPRHRFHSICPYFAMFPEDFARKQILTWTQPGDIVFDPFSGRGTTAFESLLNGRQAFGTDVSPVAACLSAAKADPPTEGRLHTRVEELRSEFVGSRKRGLSSPFFAACFHPKTLSQLLFLRTTLRWRDSRVDRFLTALALGRLHGESHRSPAYFSNRMPRTISTKPRYSIAWWKRYGYVAPDRDVFAILEREVRYRFRDTPAHLRGRVVEADARRAASRFPSLAGRVALVVTSPPYLDTTNFREDQWLRLWFLGADPHPPTDGRQDDRHYGRSRYWDFLSEAWAGVVPLLRRDAQIVVRIGGAKLTRDEAVQGLLDTMRSAWGSSVEVAASTASTIINSQRQVFRVKDGEIPATRLEYDVRLRRASGPGKLRSSRSAIKTRE